MRFFLADGPVAGLRTSVTGRVRLRMTRFLPSSPRVSVSVFAFPLATVYLTQPLGQDGLANTVTVREPDLPRSGYDLGIFKAGLNQTPSRVWPAIAAGRGRRTSRTTAPRELA